MNNGEGSGPREPLRLVYKGDGEPEKKLLPLYEDGLSPKNMNSLPEAEAVPMYEISAEDRKKLMFVIKRIPACERLVKPFKKPVRRHVDIKRRLGRYDNRDQFEEGRREISEEVLNILSELLETFSDRPEKPLAERLIMEIREYLEALYKYVIVDKKFVDNSEVTNKRREIAKEHFKQLTLSLSRFRQLYLENHDLRTADYNRLLSEYNSF